MSTPPLLQASFPLVLLALVLEYLDLCDLSLPRGLFGFHSGPTNLLIRRILGQDHHLALIIGLDSVIIESWMPKLAVRPLEGSDPHT